MYMLVYIYMYSYEYAFLVTRGCCTGTPILLIFSARVIYVGGERFQCGKMQPAPRHCNEIPPTGRVIIFVHGCPGFCPLSAAVLNKKIDVMVKTNCNVAIHQGYPCEACIFEWNIRDPKTTGDDHQGIHGTTQCVPIMDAYHTNAHEIAELHRPTVTRMYAMPHSTYAHYP